MHEQDSTVTRLETVRAQIRQAEADFGRKAGSTALVAVSKTLEADQIRPALEAGQRVFGENRVQEAQSKWPALRQAYRDVELHLIGSLQSNKAEDAVRTFDVIEVVDRPKLATAIKAAMDRTGLRPRVLVQVNTGEEAQKGGVAPQGADALVAACRALGLQLEGLMCIPPEGEPPSPHFALLAAIARRNGLSILSMGMSADYPAAIQCGATHVRIGSAIFGPR